MLRALHTDDYGRATIRNMSEVHGLTDPTPGYTSRVGGGPVRTIED